MAVPQKKPNKGQIQKGEVRNPGGKPKLPEHIQEIRKSSKVDIIEAYYKYAKAEVGKVPEPKTLLEKGIKRVIEEFASEKGNGYTGNISELWDRVIGKSEASIDITSNGESLTPQVVYYLPESALVKPKDK